ncbi:helix-turn-helix domain-containing protein [Sphaerotilus mobilis]|uniref:Cytoskeleton protein RodZ n=1 Tax=Sphaerotilus mobilis TaxID=47994 RepID=A0A4Q7LWV6_9BURK|nr:RodZ domain-containing protein [Sphaerotilus mobilis]RZS58658.1 cytoskeleton protein RodZ [Sphaerotilus mobilis]
MSEATSAGAMLRQAREQRGLDLDQLALLLKVPVRKLEALEADRYDELPGTAFVRGLATAIARQLDMDPALVLAALPSGGVAPVALESVTRGLATPYREPFERQRLTQWRNWLRPSLVAPLSLLLLALLVWQAPAASTWLPDGLVQSWSDLKASLSDDAPDTGTTVTETPPLSAEVVASGVMASADGGDSGGAVAVAGAPSAVIETVHSAPREDVLLTPALPASANTKTSAKSSAAAAAAASAAEPTRPAYARTVVLRTRADSWIEARDAAGAVLLSRMLPAGEMVGLEGSLPIRLKIGNADGTEVLFKGKPVDLAPLTRENVARVELN